MNLFTPSVTVQPWVTVNNTCRACGGVDFDMVVDLGLQPLAGGFLSPESPEIEMERYYPLSVHVCNHCGLLQILHVIPADHLYRQYQFSSSTIQPLVAHFSAYARWMKDRFSPEFIVEFGSNDGVLLSPIAELGIKALGVDVSENIISLARGKGLTVINDYFNESVADLIIEEYGQADIVTGSNVFAHSNDPGVILRAARKLLRPGGHLCLEVMYAGDLLERLQWDTMYHEHLNFYGLATLDLVLQNNGFHVVDLERNTMHAGSLRVVAAIDPAEPASMSVENLRKFEVSRGLSNPETWRSFGHRIHQKINATAQVMRELSSGKRIWAYGAAGRATMWLNACKMDYLEAVVDASPLRAGRLMPGIHTPIVYPAALRENPPDYIFVTAWNYLDEIRAKEDWYEGQWVVPSPELKVIQ